MIPNQAAIQALTGTGRDPSRNVTSRNIQTQLIEVYKEPGHYRTF